MSLYNPKPGLGDVSSYQVSSTPYLSSSLAVPASTDEPLEIKFPRVTKFIIVTNTLQGSATNTPFRFGFSSNGVKGVEDNNYLILNNGESFEADFRVTSLFLRSESTLIASASVAAGITGIESMRLVNNWSGSLGVG